MNHKDQFQAYCKEVETGIDQYLPTAQTRPAQLHSAMRYSMEAGGKRLRPILVLASRDMFSPNVDALPAAVAVECLHSYTLIHDDLPCMDNSELRRGKPSCHIQFDEATAVLAGDALLTHAFQILATEYVNEPSISAQLTAILSKAAGSQYLIGGQMEDVANEGCHPEVETLDYIHRNKTAALLTASLHMGAILGGANKDQIEKILQIGECIGLTFQIVDDLLDQNGKESKIGKPVGADRENKKTTYLSLYSAQNAQGLIQSLTKDASRISKALAGKNSFIVWLVNQLANRSN
ncbi:MAG: polyprenyl synthetase family protein [Opitutae bacterium]|jgi:geranylgeranyl diphosphate synthase, type II|nr:polyprenyl synthetase family protein [Opitutae bacterium]MBT5379476.1 polyprenyl synthetase family protein [Opitutae bacterium]MBT5691736.1 polyprenyl synthetase family protein [Opitutae bacterium]MBT6461265.1 polyprenyl synthetase family protein [Opitutae bacterium]MBT6958859.1 polyprenyl synthetase family protein [Opitutae bacterium]